MAFKRFRGQALGPISMKKRRQRSLKSEGEQRKREGYFHHRGPRTRPTGPLQILHILPRVRLSNDFAFNHYEQPYSTRDSSPPMCLMHLLNNLSSWVCSNQRMLKSPMLRRRRALKAYRTIIAYGITTDDIWNFNRTGFNIGVSKDLLVDYYSQTLALTLWRFQF